MHLIVGKCDRFADPIIDRTSLPFEPSSHRCQRRLGGLLARSLTADAIDDDENAVRGIAVKTVLVDRPLKPWMAVAGSFQRRSDVHEGHQS